MKVVVGVIGILMLVSCSTASLSSKTFSVETNWVRNTLKDSYLGPRLLHRMAPVVYKDLVIQGNGIDGISAYHRKTGHLKWRLLIDGGVEAEAELAQDRLYVGGKDGQFYCLQPSDGRVLWTFPLPGEAIGAPYVSQNRVFFISGNDSTYALDAFSGKLVWVYSRRATLTQSVRGASRPALKGLVLYVGSADGFLVALDSKTGSFLWEKQLNRNKRFFDVDGTVVFDGASLLVSAYDDGLYRIKADGGEIEWRVEEGGFLPVTIHENWILHPTSGGKLLALDRLSGKRVWEYDLQGRGVASQPVVHKGLVVFGETQGAIRFLQLQSGKEVGHFEPGRGSSSRVTIDPEGHSLLFISNEANLFSLRADWIEKGVRWPSQ